MIELEVEFPYVHSTGPALERFFEGLKERVIWGRRCDGCDRVVVPARDYCDTCGSDLDAWIEVSPEGVVRGMTTVTQHMTITGLEPPFAYVRVLLDGAGTELLHLAAHPGDLATGTRVRAVWADARTGTIRDIAGFEAVP